MMAGERNLELIKHELEHLTDAHNQMVDPDFDFYTDFSDESKAVLKTLTKQMLKAVKRVCEKKIAQANTAQLNRKISINSLYGAWVTNTSDTSIYETPARSPCSGSWLSSGLNVR
ncbi:DNA polymerase [Klebsiella phage CPRSB]|nr:DNA polymerase [Klebsiella phage CPRSB]